MLDVAGFSDGIAEPHLGFAHATAVGGMALGPTPIESFVDGLHAGRLVPGYGGLEDPDMDPVALFSERGPGLWPGWRPRDVVSPGTDVARSMFPPAAARRASHPLAAASPPAPVTPPKPGLQATTAALDQAFLRPAARRSGMLDVTGFVRDVRNYLDAPIEERPGDASPLWRSLQLSLAGIGGRLEGSAGRPTMMRLPDAGRELVAATVPEDVIGDLEGHALRLAAQQDLSPSPQTPAYFGPGKVALGVAQRFVRSVQGRRMTESLLAGGPSVHSSDPPRGTLWAARAAAQAPRGAIPAAGAGSPADVVAGFDYQLLNAMDQWESAFPGRAPYSTPVDAGAGNENPDFKNAAPEIPRWDLQAAAASGSGGGAGGPVDVKAAQILQEMGLLGSGGVADFQRGMAAASQGDGGGWGFQEGMLEQGAEQAMSMALITPVIQVVQEVSRPLLKELPEGSPGAGISAAEKGIEEADSEKLEYVAQQILQRVQMMIETEKDRRGY